LVAVSSMGKPRSMAVMHQVKSAMLWSGLLPSRLGGAPASSVHSPAVELNYASRLYTSHRTEKSEHNVTTWPHYVSE
jgi:hypothetical protein